MKTETNTNTKLYVHFHLGRGGYYNNPNHLVFVDESNFQNVIRRGIDNGDTIITYDWDDERHIEVTRPDDEWQLIDSGDNVILQGRNEIEAMTGVLDYDGIYSSEIVTTADDLSHREEIALKKAYENGEYMTDELREYIEENII